ncbi:hypothetical protein KUW19_00205 [Ferrimonas balearica]|uniref:hypothetical protein n=1 Tax=Ferrimonas balearica TaxID=44012 RepID=UPI001C979FEF|nr:hypothetical protein [Ferrimonas balearica]MBY6104903.1 hypothetical protein [Ferrimonas balearica]
MDNSIFGALGESWTLGANPTPVRAMLEQSEFEHDAGIIIQPQLVLAAATFNAIALAVGDTATRADGLRYRIATIRPERDGLRELDLEEA